jgi:hypothetical protein
MDDPKTNWSEEVVFFLRRAATMYAREAWFGLKRQNSRGFPELKIRRKRTRLYEALAVVSKIRRQEDDRCGNRRGNHDSRKRRTDAADPLEIETRKAEGADLNIVDDTASDHEA